MGEPTSFGPKGPGRILGDATSVSAGTTQSSRSDPQLKVRRRKPYQDNLDVETVEGPFADVPQSLGLESQLPEVQHIYGDVHVHSSPAPNDGDAIQRRLEMELADGTTLSWAGGKEDFCIEMVPQIIRAIHGRESSLDDPDAKNPKSFAEHYISLAPLPRYRHFDTSTYLLSKDHHSNKNTVCTVHSCPKPR